jgi:hypothetical protein
LGGIRYEYNKAGRLSENLYWVNVRAQADACIDRRLREIGRSSMLSGTARPIPCPRASAWCRTSS